MKLIAKKPCSFGGKKFFIGEEIPTELVADSSAQENLGVLTVSSKESEALVKSSIQITVKGSSDGEPATVISATPEEIRSVLSIMQLSAEEAVKAISEIQSDNVLILLHAADSRKMVKNAAKEQADNIFPASGNPNESTGGNAATGTNMEGADT